MLQDLKYLVIEDAVWSEVTMEKPVLWNWQDYQQ